MEEKLLKIFWDGNKLIYVDRTHNKVIKRLPLWLRAIQYFNIMRIGLDDDYKREIENNLNIITADNRINRLVT